ncbi:TIGR02301 family protein [Nitratireductor sp. ZSWI3]|uniref:TIGR02301 family protein n=1 Tax=Nitratireductor sp. ZSWI3 TaxID=2966359 RepID=UPI00214F8193|nr:TIGR02301 family protein [Nitratireductor sp. ZSWI3]MCR4266884.1 TIGR02301 family protein [Nitratireductor sp. ZSWI3]
MNRGSAIALLLLLLAATPARAQEATYEQPLLRLAEILGAVHYLRNLCGEESDDWRGRMQELLQTEAPSPARREKLVASFNRGYRAFAGTYATCTAQARSAVENYMKEGASLSRDIAQRYGN